MNKNKRLSIEELKANSSAVINQNLEAIKGGNVAAEGCHLNLVNGVLVDECTGKPKTDCWPN
jgi:hypothetical protein